MIIEGRTTLATRIYLTLITLMGVLTLLISPLWLMLAGMMCDAPGSCQGVYATGPLLFAAFPLSGLYGIIWAWIVREYSLSTMILRTFAPMIIYILGAILISLIVM